MRQIKFDPEALEGEKKKEWDAWANRAKKATDTLVKKWESKGKLVSDDFNNNIWGDLKRWMTKNVFGGNCAYCETQLNPEQQYDGEHYRPKAGVINVKDGKQLPPETATRPSGEEVEHPGYFWLAYRWENLLPSCSSCNSGHGKQNQFTIRKSAHILDVKLTKAEKAKLKEKAIESPPVSGIYLLGPRDLDQREVPELLHPIDLLDEDPLQHLEFQGKGTIKPRKINGKESPRGKATIKICRLDRGTLNTARQAAQERCFYLEYNMEVWYKKEVGSEDPFMEALEDVIERVEAKVTQQHRTAVIEFLRKRAVRAMEAEREAV